MQNMSNETGKARARRMQLDREELAERIMQALPDDGALQPRPGLYFQRRSTPAGRVYATSPPSFCVIAQGSKDILLGEDVFHYDAAHYLITTMELPLVGEVIDASPQCPYLSARLLLDPSLVTSVMLDSGLSAERNDGTTKAVDVSALDVDLLDATLRLVRLVEAPDEYRVLAPLIVREIIYRLLTGAQADRMRHLTTCGGQTHRMARAVEILRENFDKPLRIEDLARELSMSVSGFHAHFKAATAMSPLQFQKQLRLQEARRLMLNENLDAAEAGYRVGYDDPSHFNREYKRHFGKPPRQDVAALKVEV
jgi:AraC-like DNA-binding protein